MYVATVWEEGWCVWENMYDRKPTRDQIIEDMLQEGVNADAWDHISITKED